MPFVSVIIPCYNQEQYLSFCLDAVLSQSLKNLEVICVNDGSSDDTGSVLSDYARRDDRVKVIQQENQEGAGRSRNAAMEIAAGEFIIFCDADDEYPSTDTLERLYTAAVRNGANAAGGSYSIYDEARNAIEYEFDGLLWGQTFKEEGMIRYRDYQFDYGFTRFLFKADALRQSGVKFSSYRRFEDPPFLVSALDALGSFYALPDVVYQARVEHKQVAWDSATQVDLIRGITDNLRYSKAHCLPKLHELTLRRLEEEYRGVYFWALADSLVFPALVQANGEVDQRLIANRFPERMMNGFFLIEPLRQQIANAQKWGNDILDLQKAVVAERNDKERVQGKLCEKELELSLLYNSTTWKVGSILTALPRRFRDARRRGETP